MAQDPGLMALSASRSIRGLKAPVPSVALFSGSKCAVPQRRGDRNGVELHRTGSRETPDMRAFPQDR